MEGARGAVGGHLSFKPMPSPQSSKPTTSIQSMRLSRVQAMDAYSRHKQFVNDYVRFYGRKESIQNPANAAPRMTDEDLLRKEHRFLRTAEDDTELTYEKMLAKKYYDKLFKEYAIADLRLYRDGKIGLRWRTEQEVIDGKGQFTCGARGCTEAAHLSSFEVHFAYVENGEKKAALVKVRLCPPCGEKLNYRRNKDKRKEEKKAAKRQREQEATEGASKRAAPEEGEESAGTKEATTQGGDAQEHSEQAEKEAEAAAAAAAEEAERASEKEKESAKAALVAKEAAVWQQKPTMEKTKEEEFDEYFRDLFP